MSVALIDGALGLEARHEWELLSRPLNGPRVLPRIKLDRIGGLYSVGEIEDMRIQHTGRLGETVVPGVMKGKTITYEGRVQAATLQEMRALATELRSAFSDVINERVMNITPDAAYGSGIVGFRARPLALDMDEEQTRGARALPTPYQRSFVLSLRMADPRMYWAAPQSASGNPVSVNNQGSAPTDPVIVLSGADPGGVYIHNDDLNVSLAIYAVAAGDLTFDFRSRSITRVGQSVDGYMTPDSTWWDEGVPGLRPGPQTISATPGASMTVSYYHAFF